MRKKQPFSTYPKAELLNRTEAIAMQKELPVSWLATRFWAVGLRRWEKRQKQKQRERTRRQPA